MINNWPKEAKDKRVGDVILMLFFWNLIVYILKVMSPFVQVLRMTDNKKQHMMGYIYKTIDKTNEMIQKFFDGNEEKYKKIFVIIDERWNCQFHRPLHVIGYYLNSKFFYKNTSIEFNAKVINGLYKCVARLVLILKVQDKIIHELSLYKNVDGLFGISMVV
ncbi:unnamed protein product [Musa textilis]